MPSIIPVTQDWSGREPGQGERELHAGQVAANFYMPDTDAEKRLECYVWVERLLDPDQHQKLYEELNPNTRRGFGRESQKPKTWVPVDFPGMLARLVRHYTFGPEFSIKAETEGTQAELDRMVKHNGLFQLFRQVTEDLPAYGDAVLRVDVEDTETLAGEKLPQAVVKYVKPHHYFPKLNMLDATKVDEVTLAWVYQLDAENAEDKGREPAAGGMAGREVPGQSLAVLREVHKAGKPGESGTYEYMVNRWDGKKLGDDLPTELERLELDSGPQETGISAIPIVHVGYQRKAGEHFGNSELYRVRRVMLALENRLSQEDQVLDKHAKPKLIVGPGILDDKGEANLDDFDVIEIEPDILEKAVKPEYLTWNFQLEAIKHEIEKLEEYLFVTTETSPASFGLERDGSQVESARALKFKAHRTVSKVMDLRTEWERAIRQVMRLAQERELVARDEDNVDGYTPTEVMVKFGSVIVEDQTQEVQDYTMLKTANLVSRERAIMDLYNLNAEEARSEVARIDQDMVNEAASQSFTAPTTPPPAPGGPPRGPRTFGPEPPVPPPGEGPPAEA